jgi:hypothetical protein
MMASDKGNPAPPPAPVARLPRLPSNAKIVRPRNADVSEGPTALAATPTVTSQLSCGSRSLSQPWLLPMLSTMADKLSCAFSLEERLSAPRQRQHLKPQISRERMSLLLLQNAWETE